MLLNAQTQIDSLAKYSYEELKESIDENEYTDIERSKLYTLGYLLKAKKEKNKIQIAEAYYLLAVFNSDSVALKYSDSIISITKNIKGHEKFPAIGYYFKGYCLYVFGKNQESLNNYFLALKYLEVNRNIRLEIDTRMSIIALMSNWKDTKEVVKNNEELVLFLERIKDKNVHYRNRYLTAIYNLSLSYFGINEYRKGLLNVKKGIEEISKAKDTIEYYDFVCVAGTAQYYLKNYKAAIDSSLIALPHLKGTKLAMRYYYLAKSYNKLNQLEKAQFHFLKTDSIYQATKDVFPEMRDAYEHIIEYYKSKNDVQNQIKYYDRLIAVDKVIDSTYTYVTETVNKKFDTPQAIAERNRLVEEAKAKESSWKYSFAAISVILLVILGVLVAAFRRQKYYKKRFENIMSIEQSRNALNQTKEKETSKKKDIDVPEEIVESILQQLETFEVSQKFTKQISLTELAKKLGTNPKYLSKVINGHYQKNFSTYINELRIEYVISKLKEDSKFRNYTIKAIGKEAGFGNTESFSKAFQKTTGINVSYFINQLQKRLES